MEFNKLISQKKEKGGNVIKYLRMSDDGSTIKYLLETYQPSGRTKTKI